MAQPRDRTYTQISLFAYTVQSHAPLYRAVMEIFLKAKASYRIQLRPQEIASELSSEALALTTNSEDEMDRPTLDRALDQLVAWGNLRRSHDTGRVATLEDFRRRHHIYQMTPAGEEAERAVGRVLAAIESSGSLQRVMLKDIARQLARLARWLDPPNGEESTEPSSDALYSLLFNISKQFQALTENASIFLARVHETLDEETLDREVFRLYKQAVIQYLNEFVTDLDDLAPRISDHLRRVEAMGAESMIRRAARADAAPTVAGVHDPSGELLRQWRGVVGWFLGDRAEQPVAERLHDAALDAVLRLLRVLQRLQEKQFRKADRTADLLRLAGWFEELAEPAESVTSSVSVTEATEQAHRLYAAAFGLFGARHLGQIHDDPELVPHRASWWDAPPVPVPPVLRKLGKISVLGRTAKIVDHSKARRFLAEHHRREQEARRRALARFIDLGPFSLSSLPPLSADEFALLLELLDRLYSAPPEGARGIRTARSADGLLALSLAPAEGRARLTGPRGTLTAPAAVLEIVDLTSPRSATTDEERARA